MQHTHRLVVGESGRPFAYDTLPLSDARQDLDLVAKSFASLDKAKSGGPILGQENHLHLAPHDHGGRWHAWVSCHPLDDPDQTDRMTTEHATSDDGVDWIWHGTALAGRPGEWDARGVRVAAVRLDGPRPVAWYDGRATAEQNWEEQTGLATIDEPGHLTAVGTGPAGVSPYGLGGLRYVSPVQLPDGSTRFYVEVTRPDGAHDLRTVLVPHAPS